MTASSPLRVRHGVGHTRDQIRLIVGIGHGHLARRLACTVPVCVIRIGRRLSALGHRHQPVKPVIFIYSATLLHIADGQRISASSSPEIIGILFDRFSLGLGQHISKPIVGICNGIVVCRDRTHRASCGIHSDFLRQRLRRGRVCIDFLADCFAERVVGIPCHFAVPLGDRSYIPQGVISISFALLKRVDETCIVPPLVIAVLRMAVPPTSRAPPARTRSVQYTCPSGRPPHCTHSACIPFFPY